MPLQGMPLPEGQLLPGGRGTESTVWLRAEKPSSSLEETTESTGARAWEQACSAWNKCRALVLALAVRASVAAWSRNSWSRA